MIRLASLEEVNEVEDELRDRFGPLPWQTQNLLYVVRLRMHAQRAGIETISREGQRIVLRFKSDLGGARRALQRLLGQGAEIGNTQIRLELDGLADGWEKPLLDAVSKLADFAERMAAGLAAVR
jgi:transcription-repair coupling factor (superfamily II helicase)